MTPTKFAVEPFYTTLRVEAGEARVRALVYSDDIGFDALIAWDAGVVSAHVTEVSRGPRDGYVKLAERDAQLDEQCRHAVDCDADFADQLEAFLRDHYADENADEGPYGGDHCAGGCSACLGVRSYAGF